MTGARTEWPVLETLKLTNFSPVQQKGTHRALATKRNIGIMCRVVKEDESATELDVDPEGEGGGLRFRAAT